MSEHTDGPWECHSGVSFNPDTMEATKVFTRIVAGEKTIATMKEYGDSADTRLITAAPDMLELLEEILTWCFFEQEKDAMKRIEAVIAKAEGGDE